MAIADDFTISSTGDIRHSANSNTYTTLELHRWLQDLADDATPASANDIVDITDETPSDRSTDNIITLINGYNIDDDASEYFYDGSIVQTNPAGNGTDRYDGIVVVGSVVAGTELQIVQNNALITSYWGTGLNADAAQNILLRLCIKTREDGADIDGRRLRVQAREFNDTYAEFTVNGTALGNNVFAISTADDLNNDTATATVATWDKFSNTEGLRLIDVDNDTVNEEYYSEWDIGAGTLPATTTINDLYEWTKHEQRRGTASNLHGINGELFRGITHSFAYDGEAGTGPVTNDAYAWGLIVAYNTEVGGPFTLDEGVKIGTSSFGQIIGIDDDGTTGTLIVSVQTGTPANAEAILGLSSGATAVVNGAPTGEATGGGRMLILASDDDGTTGNLYVQLLVGSAPADDYILQKTSVAADTVVVNGTVTTRTVVPSFLGQSTGSAIIGAYGIGIATNDLSQNDLLTDLSDTPNQPPNNVTFTVLGLVSGDRVLVGPEDGSGGLDTDQLLGATGSNASGAGTYVATAAIPTDTPSAGEIRVFNGDTYDEVAYTSYTSATFTLTGTLPNAGASHTFDYDNEGGTPPFTIGETLTFGGGGTAELLTLDDRGSVGSMVVRMISGSDPIDNDTISGGTSGATGDVDTTTVPVDAVGGFISYIDIATATTEESFTSVYLADRTLFIRVRDGGGTPIKTFETTATLGTGGGSATAIRTTDE
jgi:hypothetical protein